MPFSFNLVKLRNQIITLSKIALNQRISDDTTLFKYLRMEK